MHAGGACNGKYEYAWFIFRCTTMAYKSNGVAGYFEAAFVCKSEAKKSVAREVLSVDHILHTD